MTTQVTINPAGHTVMVTAYDLKTDGTKTNTSFVLKPGSPPHVTHIHSSRCLLIEEVPAPTIPT